jgi:hypothetical protein
MPSPGHAADLERVLTRAAEECELEGAWFGQGLPQALKTAIEASGKKCAPGSSKVAFVEAGVESSAVPSAARRVVAISVAGFDDLPSLIEKSRAARPEIVRLICPLAVFDFTAEGIRVREVRHGLTAADLQRKLGAPLWAGPDLKELGTR